MSASSRFLSHRRTRRTAPVALEALESRELLATTSTAAIATGFVAPNLTGLINQALYHHQNTGPAVIRTMDAALQSQLTNGVLTALQGGTLTPADFGTSVTNVTTSFEQNVNAQLSPRFPNITGILTGQAKAIQQQISAIGLQLADGLITQAQATTLAAQSINSITGGAVFAVHNSVNNFARATQTLETQLNLLPPALATGATPSLTLTQAQAIAIADADAYEATIAYGAYTHSNITSQVNAAITTFETSVNAITTTATTTPAQQLTAAITALDSALLDSDGLFGPNGSLRRNGF